MEKQRPPIEQLKEAGKKATEMLKARGIVAKESVLEDLSLIHI